MSGSEPSVVVEGSRHFAVAKCYFRPALSEGRKHNCSALSLSGYHFSHNVGLLLCFRPLLMDELILYLYGHYWNNANAGVYLCSVDYWSCD